MLLQQYPQLLQQMQGGMPTSQQPIGLSALMAPPQQPQMHQMPDGSMMQGPPMGNQMMQNPFGMQRPQGLMQWSPQAAEAL